MEGKGEEGEGGRPFRLKDIASPSFLPPKGSYFLFPFPPPGRPFPCMSVPIIPVQFISIFSLEKSVSAFPLKI